MAENTEDRLQELTKYFQTNEIECEKYHYTVHNGAPKLSEKTLSVFNLSEDGSVLEIFNLKERDRVRKSVRRSRGKQ